MKSNKGFTLIELMIVVAILALITVMSITSYSNSVRKARRSDAMDSLTRTAVDFERCFTANGTYLNKSSPAKPCSVMSLDDATKLAVTYQNSTKGFYAISVPSAVTDSTFTITATANTGDQKKDIQCYSMSLTNTGAKTSADNTGSDTTTTDACWGR